MRDTGVLGVAPCLGEHVHAGQKTRARALHGVERLLGGMELAPCGVHVLAQLRQLLVRYVEPDGTIRLYFTLEQAQTKLHRSRQSATRIFRELEYSGLIVRRKQGLGKPTLITLNYPVDAKLIQPKENGAISHE